DVRISVEEAVLNPEPQIPNTIASAPDLAVSAWRRSIPWVVAAMLAVSVVTVAWVLWPRTSSPPVMRFVAELGVDASLYTGGVSATSAAAILSPDGKTLAFSATKTGLAGDSPQLYVRRLDQLKASPLPGTEGAVKPFFSSDGQWIAFFADGRLKKVSVSGGAVITLCETPSLLGGSWSDDGFIVFAQQASGLFRVPDVGGKPEPLTKLESGEISQRWPQLLPG